jgi:hypothetical protein
MAVTPVRLKIRIPAGTERSMTGNAVASSSGQTAPPGSSPREGPTWNSVEGTPSSSTRKRKASAADYIEDDDDEEEADKLEEEDVFLASTFRRSNVLNRVTGQAKQHPHERTGTPSKKSKGKGKATVLQKNKKVKKASESERKLNRSAFKRSDVILFANRSEPLLSLHPFRKGSPVPRRNGFAREA